MSVLVRPTFGTLRGARDGDIEFQEQLGIDSRDGEALATLVMAFTNYAAMTYRWEGSEAEVDRILGALEHSLSMLGRSFRTAP